MSFATWLSVATICALGAASPGPSLAVVLRHAVAGSRAAGIVCALAHAAGVGLYALLTVLGLAALMARYPQLYRAVATAGALYLVWLGIGLLRTGAADGGDAAAVRTRGLYKAARDGFLMALLNPKIAVFFLALFSQFVGPDPGAFEVGVLAVTALTIDALWYLAVATTFSGPRARDRLRGKGGAIARLSGAVLLAAAAWALAVQWLA